jgi:hypothetical protein
MKPEKVLRWKRSSTGNCLLNITKEKRLSVFLRAEDGRYGVNMVGQTTPATWVPGCPQRGPGAPGEGRL